MLIFKEDSRTGVSCGLNDFGELFIGNSRSGYNLPDTPGEPREDSERFRLLVDRLDEAHLVMATARSERSIL